MGDRHCLAIDIGGTKMACGIVNNDGDLLLRDVIPTPKGTDGDALSAALVALVESVRQRSDVVIDCCGVGCGGPMEPDGVTVSPLNITAWKKFPLKERLANSLEMDVTVDNDAKAFALGEWGKGSAHGVDSFLAMVVSTGIGGGLVVDGRLINGRLGNAGHIGHLVVEPQGRRCVCGVIGCLEAEASGTAIAAMTGWPAKDASSEIRRRTGTMVGRAVASVVTLLDLSLCIVAGSVALGFGEPFFTAAQDELERCTGLSYTEGARIVRAGLGDAGPLIGAGALGFGIGRDKVQS